ncbi:ABC transporter permease [Natronogracilivirga saccharolytica]|uniref:ABC transporter permease n=1 Tax=Natronogracilivirga saccharolytica TaxID=2812953 RepID=A0A8J7RIA6_9BACT|nr:ABC transporter permease [Natronogracilivirga saccharolytica]MBP3191130.1 ABC transporter permease [Natronogracilivirga saccharolytica]
MIGNLVSEFLQDIRKQKLRTGLTIIAICWGTIAVITLLAFGEGLSQRMMEGLRGGGNQVMMFYGNQTSKSFEGLDVGRRIRFHEDDIELLRRSVPEIEIVSAQYGRSVGLRSDFENTNTHMEGVDAGFDEMRSMYPVAGGRFINQRDVNERRRVVFLGDEIASQLFPEGDAVGSNIMIDNNTFTVIGVMQEKMQMAMSHGPDARRAVIPHTTFRQIYNPGQLGSILIRPADPAYQQRVESRVREIMARKYRFHADDEQAIGVWDFIEAERVQNQVSTGVKIFLFIVGFFTLLIAGVGVANIMYVVVKERTREIGVKKAIGAKNKHIISQFIFEALFICLIGGVIGVLFSAGLILGVQSLNLEGDVAAFLGNPVISLESMAMTSGVLTVIGLAAGVFPARRAALVNPVESLRYE